MGGPFVQTSQANPAGFYEDAALVHLHDSLLAQLGLNEFLRASRWPWRTTVLAVAAAYREAMQEAITTARGGWKDPRFSLTLEAWLPLFPSPPKVIVCLRSPKSHVDSVTAIFGFVDRAEAERYWAHQYRRLLDVIRDYNLDACCVEYDALIEQPDTVVTELSRFVGRNLNSALLERDLRHHVGHVRPQHRQLYDEVLALSPQPPRASVEVARPASYIAEVEALADCVLAARLDWLEAIGSPEPHLAGGPTPAIIERTQAASSTYEDATRDAQAALQKLEAPPEFEDFHEETRALFDYERLSSAAFVLATRDSPGGAALQTALDCWRRFSGPAPFQRRLEARQRAFARATSASA